MASSRSDLLVRVQKLLALSTSSNVHEAASAAAAAQALINRHQLQSVLDAEATVDGGDDPADPITDGSEAPLEIARRPRRWKSALAQGLAERNGGVVWSAEHDDGMHLCFCGRRSGRLAVVALFEWLQVRIEWLSASAGASSAGHPHPGRDRRWHEGFRVGAAEAIVERLAAGAGAAGTNDAGDDGDGGDDVITPAALIRAEPLLAARAAAVDRFVKSRLRLGQGKRYSVDGRGFERGRAAGQALALSPPPTMTKPKPKPG